MAKIRPRERAAIIQSLRAGVTPRVGLEHIQVGRVKEVKALIKDLDRIADGGSAFRLVLGQFGAGKSFFLQLIRYIALEKGMVVMNADLTPDRRLYASGGQARSLYQELARNISTRAHSDGNAMLPIVEKFITEQRRKAESLGMSVEEVLKNSLSSLSELVGGYDFAHVISLYWKAYNEGFDVLKADAVRYLRAEFSSRTDAKKALDIRSIIDDLSVYDHLKLMARFVRLAGYKGLLITLDEMVNLYKLHSGRARSSNYEQILRILNDCLQGGAEGIGFLLGGTPEFLEDQRKGLYSYEALRSRLAKNSFAEIAGVTDYDGPILRLDNLSPEEMFVLLVNIRTVFSNGDKEKELISDEGITAFLEHCAQHIGEAYFKTPRNTIKAFTDLLSVLEQNPEIKWESLIQKVSIEDEKDVSLVTVSDGKAGDDEDDDELATFTL